MYRYVPGCLDWFGMGHRCFVGTCAGVHLWGFPVAPSIDALWFVLFQKLELMFPPKNSKLKKNSKGVVFGIHLTIFSGKLEKETSHITWHIRDILGLLTPRPCRGGTAEEAVQKTAEHIRRKEICLEGCSGVKGEGWYVVDVSAPRVMLVQFG